MLVYASKCSFAVNALDVYEIRDSTGTLTGSVFSHTGNYTLG